MKINNCFTRFCLLFAILPVTMLSLCGGKKTDIKDKSCNEIIWLDNIDSALVIAKNQEKPVMIDFTAAWCPPCKTMEDSTFSNGVVITKSRKFITVRIDVDEQRDVAIEYNGNARKYGGIGIPNILFITANKERVKHIVGFHNADALFAVMDSVISVTY